MNHNFYLYAGSVCSFIGSLIHGIAAGKSKERLLEDFENMKDCFENLCNEFERIMRNY